MPYYECVFIARQDVHGGQVENLASHFGNVIAENGGTVTKTEHWGLRNLNYRIRKNRKGHYVLMNIDGPWQAVAEMERLMRIHDDVLRYLTVRVEELEEGPSAQMQARPGRETGRRDRGDRDRGDRDRGDRDRGDRDRGDRDRGDRDRGDRERGERGDRDRGGREREAPVQPSGEPSAQPSAQPSGQPPAQPAETEGTEA
jgi:small subunit ribosomal protein S6